MWIELHDTVRDHPKLLKLARDLGLSHVVTLGHVTSLWLWTLRMAPDGNLSSFDVEDIELGAQWDGEPGKFVEAMKHRRLLDEVGGHLHLHDWSDYAEHLKSAQRKRNQRERKAREQAEREAAEAAAKAKCHVTSRDVTGQARNSGPVTQTDQTDQSSTTNVSRDSSAPAEAICQVTGRLLSAKEQERLRALLPIADDDLKYALQETRRAPRPSPAYCLSVLEERRRTKPPDEPRPPYLKRYVPISEREGAA